MPVRNVLIEHHDHGQRLDNYLFRTLKGVPKSRIYKIIRSGEVRVNSGRVKASYKLKDGDQLRIPPVRTSATDDPVSDHRPHDHVVPLRSAVIFEDDEILAINKPPDMAVHGGSGVSSGVIEVLRQELKLPRLELVHRLDRGTSGVLLMAKHRQSLLRCQDLFRRRQVTKVYELLVHGEWPWAQKVVQAKLQRYLTQWGERRVRVDAGGMSARTDFERVAVGANISRLKARIHTGRTHQIRVHAAHSGHSIVGDDKYKAKDAPKIPKSVPLCLHAGKLAFEHQGSVLKLIAPTTAAFEAVWGQGQVGSSD